jgi:conjugative relaxase-like TrwC/TraI family protein
MLRITTSESTEAAIRYYEQALKKGNYYFGQQEIEGKWGGRGAELLDLTGKVEDKDFINLLRNIRPDGFQLTAGNPENRRPGYDFTFDVPKSVSLMQALTEDQRIVEAMHRAVNETMKDIERQMHARVRKNKAYEDRETGNMIWAGFTDFATRPAQAGKKLPLGAPDPHLHIHVFAINATYDEVEGIWKAGEFSRIKRDAPYYQALYHTRLVGELQKLGYKITATKDAFEIEGIDRATIEKFSRRTAEIDELARRLKIIDPDKKAKLGAKSRVVKGKEAPLDKLVGLWKAALSWKEADDVQVVSCRAALEENREPVVDVKAAREAVDHAFAHELERVSEVSERRLLGTALARCVGLADAHAVLRAYREKEGVIRARVGDETRVTSREILEEEHALIEMMKEGRASVRPLVREEYQFRNALFNDPTKDTEEQKAAIRHILKSEDWAVGVVGRAGTGKTTLLQEIAEGLKHDAGCCLTVCAPTAAASRGVLRKEGFKDAQTVKKLLDDPDLQQKMRGGVLWIDEAGMIGNKDLLRLLATAKLQNVRKVVLAGDYRQIRSVPRGDAFQMLEENGLKVARLENILRQKNPRLKDAVKAISKGQVGKGFHLLAEERAIVETPDKEARQKALARAYVKASLGRKPTKNLVVSPTHKEGEEVTAAIREELKARGHLKGREHTYIRLAPTGWTEAEKADPVNYEPGNVVQFQKHTPFFKAGERAKVAEVDTKAGKVYLQKAPGLNLALPLHQANRFNVYWPQSLKLMKNDVIRITKNASLKKGKQQVINGQMAVVKGFTPLGDIRLQDGKVLPRDFAHIHHGHCITADSAQATTVDRVFASISSDSFSAADMRRFYVAMSRARYEAHVFTDDRKELLKAVARDQPRRTAHEIAEMEHRQRRSRELSIEVARQATRVMQRHGFRPDRSREEREEDRGMERTKEITRDDY